MLRVALAMLFAGLALAVFWIGSAVARAPAGLPETVAYNPLVAGIIAQVTTPTLAYEMEGLTGERPVTVAGISYTIATRNSYRAQAISMSTRYAYEQLAATGLSVTYHNYTWGSYNWRNVVAEKPGLADPGEIYLITAHIDDMPNSSDAPGADDNASGSVAVMLAARLLADRPLAYTVRFVLFTGEEQGLRGSAAYAADCAARGEDIRGVINLDMVAYNSDALPIIDLYASSSVPASIELTRIFSDVVGVYGLDLIPERFVDESVLQYSDQWSFLTRGYPAFMAIEDDDDFTPYYHTSQDALATLDLDYYADFTRAAIATLVHLGGLFPGVGWGQVSGTVTDLEAGRPLPGATVSTFWPADCYTFTATAGAGGVYTLSLPVGVYTLTGWANSPPYYSTVITGVSVFNDAVTVQSFTLAPWLRQYFPLVAYGDN
ncbi:MAG: M20/M25/M40 family metallo-hydrolase [Anaerolineae bacterium]|nr:M20/M25/M40 family metallo-hydrolase [Anaerolineae bacterium]